jgi:hypothetical protein
MISTIGRWKIKHQPDITRQCYNARPEGPGCDCADCRNFMAALDKAFPQEFLSIADLLGIDIRKPVELGHYGQEGSKLYVTDGFFHLVGAILSGRDAYKQTSATSWVADMEKLTDGLDMGFTNKIVLISEPFADKQLVQLEFQVRVPRVLPESEWLIPNP